MDLVRWSGVHPDHEARMRRHLPFELLTKKRTISFQESQRENGFS
jgi:hypothetical protein